MKKNNIGIIVFVILTILLIISMAINVFYFSSKTKCKTPTERVAEIQNTTTKDDFELKIFADKKVYKTTDKIDIWSTFKYSGEKEKIEIWHASSYITYSITDGKDFNVEGVVNDILLSTRIEKDKLYHHDYYKSGGWEADGPDADFWEKFFNEKDLFLPAGEYTITVKATFDTSSDLHNESDIKCSIEIKVED